MNFILKHWIHIALLVLITLVSFSPILQGKFTNWDDPQHITDNNLIKNISFKSLSSIFKQFINYTYVPLTTMSFMFDYSIAKDNPYFYHFVNIILHMLVVLCTFVLFLKLKFTHTVAFWSSLLFAIHPMHVEPVAWLTQRKDVLYSLFYVSSLIFYIKYSQRDSFVFYALSLICGILSVLAKPMALSLPFILLLLDWFNQRNFTWNLIIEKIPFCFSLWLIALITYVQNIHLPTNSLTEKLILWIWCLVFYIQKFLIPLELNPLYEISKPISIQNPEYFLSILIFLLVILGFILSKNRLFKFSVMFFVLSIFFLIRFNTGVDTHIVADRFMYLPSLGFCLVLGTMLNSLYESKRLIVRILIVLICSFLIFKTMSISFIWRDSISLWTYVINHSTSRPVAYINRAHAYNIDKQYDLALADLKKAETFNSKDAKYLIHFNFGLVYLDQKEYIKAIDEFSSSLKDNPFYKFAYFPRAQAWGELKELEKALKDYSAAAQIDLANYVVFNNRGNIYRALKNYPQAIEDLNHSIRIFPKYALGFYNRGNVFKDMRKYQEAINDYAQSIKLDSTIAETYFNRGICYVSLAQFDLALKDFNTAITLNPNSELFKQSREYLLKLKKETAL